MNNQKFKLSSLYVITCVLGLSSLPLVGQETEERFRPGEWDLSPFATYVDKKGNDWGFGTSVTYFPIKNFGLGGSTYWADSGGALIDNLSFEAYLRLPIALTLAPYAVGSVGYDFENNERIMTLGGGVDFRVFKKLSAFSDIQWRFAKDTKDGAFLRLGVRFSF